MRRIAVVINSRANYARIKSVIHAIREHPELELCLVVGASALLDRYGDITGMLAEQNFDIDAKIYSAVEGGNLTSMAKTAGLAIQELSTVWENHRPDVVLTVADRFETIATAISAVYMNIPLAHTQGGELSGSIDESVRHAITKLAHIHFPATQRAASRLLKLGEDPKSIYLSGCPSMDLLTTLRPLKRIPQNIGTGYEIDINHDYIIVLQHPVTTEYMDAENQIKQTIEAVRRLNMQTLWLMPNIDAGSDMAAKALRQFRDASYGSCVRFCNNFPPKIFAALLHRCACLIGNSSSGIRECAYLGVPVVNIGSRQQYREQCANVINVDYSSTQIYAAVKQQFRHGGYKPDFLYGNGGAGGYIADSLASHKFIYQKRWYDNAL